MNKTVFQDQVVIISGASSGIGRELAFQLAGQGARLVLAARNAADLESTAQDCRKAGAKALVVQTDVSSSEQCQALISTQLAGIWTVGHLDQQCRYQPDSQFGGLPRSNWPGTVSTDQLSGQRSLHLLCHTLSQTKPRPDCSRLQYGRRDGITRPERVCCQQTCHERLLRTRCALN